MEVFKTYLKAPDLALRAASVSSSDFIKQGRYSAAREQSFLYDLRDKEGKIRTAFLAKELWMYFTFMPMKENIVVTESDGMANGAHLLEECFDMEWIVVATHAVTTSVWTLREDSILYLPFSLSEGQRRSTHSATHNRQDAGDDMQ